MFHRKTPQENAIFVADSHHHGCYQETLESLFLEFLKLSKRQIFLMGDIFDFLVGPVKRCSKDNHRALILLKELSLKHEVHYFEGNHDFLLDSLPFFENIHYYPLNSQPVRFSFNQKDAYLAHGDVFLGWHYWLFTRLERCEALIATLNLFAFCLYPKILAYLKSKREKKKQHRQKSPTDFQKFAAHRVCCYLKNYSLSADSYIIEGHFHHGQMTKIETINYIGLPFFACKKKYFVVEYADNCLSLKEFESVKL